MLHATEHRLQQENSIGIVRGDPGPFLRENNRAISRKVDINLIVALPPHTIGHLPRPEQFPAQTKEGGLARTINESVSTYLVQAHECSLFLMCSAQNVTRAPVGQCPFSRMHQLNTMNMCAESPVGYKTQSDTLTLASACRYDTGS